jgi:uncharacterized protein
MPLTLVYLHGFLSSPGSAKARCLARAVDALPPAIRPRLRIPALAFSPAAAVAAEVDRCREDGDGLTLVGSSLGGYYATVIAERLGVRAVVINPAVRPYDGLRRFCGPQHNLHTGERFEVTAAHFDELAAMKVDRITRPDRYFLLQRSGDELLDWREAVAFYAGASQYVAGGGDHGWTDFDDEVPAVLRFAGVAARAAG